jgi:hypothetical protein
MHGVLALRGDRRSEEPPAIMMTLGNMRKNWVRSLAITGGILLWLVIIFVVLNLLSDILSEAVK